MTRIAVVLGSVRPNRAGGAIAEWVAAKAGAVEGVEAEVLDLASFNLPVFSEEAPPRMAAPKDPAAVAFNEALSSYDGYIIVTPEYNHSIPGALKNAIDFIVPSTLAHKPVGLVGYSYHQGIRPLEHLRDILSGFTSGVVYEQLELSLATDIADGAVADNPRLEAAVPALVQSMLAQDKALAVLR